MRKLTYILLAITLILGIFSSCSDEEKEHKFVNMSELNFGDGIYRPNPFKFLDNIPPFSWMGMPDSVRKVTELQISFNEDAVRSHASGRIILVDHNGNKIKGIVINGNALNEVNIPSGSKSVIIPISFTVNPAVGDSILHGSIMVVGNELDQVNDIHLAPQATPIASWKLTHKTGINWLRWIILFALIALLCVIGYFIYKEIIKYYIYKDITTTVKQFSITKPLHHNRFINKESKKKKQEEGSENYGTRMPKNGDKGKWTGKRGDSTFEFNLKEKPKTANYGNPNNLTYGQMGKLLGDEKPGVRFRNGHPEFDRDHATENRKPLEVKFPEGIGKHLDSNNPNNREQLHIAAFKKIAEQTGKSLDEIRVFKGDSAPVKNLAQRWGCSEEEVWRRCNNPHQIQRVLHEKIDGKTVQLVPRMYHDNVAHDGGISRIKKKLQLFHITTHFITPVVIL